MKNKFITILNKYNNFIITSHINPDGDSICCQIAIAYILNKLKKNYKIISEDTIPKRYRFIIDDYYNIVIPEFVQIPKGQKLIYQLSSSYKKEVLIVFDCSELERVGNFSKELTGFKEIINIDHHQENLKFGTLNYIEPSASSCGEIFYGLLKQNNFKIDENIAKLIYIAITTDTRFFSQANTTSNSHKIASELLEFIDVEKISFALNIKELPAVKLLGRAIEHTILLENKKILYSYLSSDDFVKSNAKNEDTDGIIEFLRNISADVKMLILFKELPGEIRINLRGKNGYNVLKFAENFGGGGHKNAAGCSIKGNLKEVMKTVLAKAEVFVC